MFEQAECERKLQAACINNGLVFCQEKWQSHKRLCAKFFDENAKKFCAFQFWWGEAQTQIKEKAELFVRPSKVTKTKIMMAAITDFGIDFSINGSP